MRQVDQVYIIDDFSKIPPSYQMRVLVSFYCFSRNAISTHLNAINKESQTNPEVQKLHDDVLNRTRIPTLFAKEEKNKRLIMAEDIKRQADKAEKHLSRPKFHELMRVMNLHTIKLADNVFNYAMFVALDVMSEWKNPKFKTRCAFIHKKGKLEAFVHYRVETGQTKEIANEQQVPVDFKGKQILYFSEINVRTPNQGTAQALMTTVLSDFNISLTGSSPNATVDCAHLLFRNYNKKAEHVYSKLGFKKGSDEIARYYDYDPNKYTSFVLNIDKGSNSNSLAG